MSRQVDLKALVSHIIRGDGLNKCRICMGDTSQGQVHLTDTVMMDGDKAVTLSELLEVITGVEIVEESECPGGVCAACAQAALAAAEFRRLAVAARALWLRAVHSLARLPLRRHAAHSALAAFLSHRDASLEILTEFDGEPGSLLDRTVPNGYERKPRILRNGPLTACPDCGKRFGSPQLLRIHLQNSDRKDVCRLCGQVFPRGVEMKNHLEIAHDETPVLCEECPTVLSSEDEFKIHEKKAHGSGAKTCSACGRTFARLSSYENHVEMHVVLACRSCGKQFSNRSCYRVHRASCEPDAKPHRNTVPRGRRSNVRDPGRFVCDHCNKSYSSRPQLKNHILWIHMDHRPYQCSWCGKRFYTPARLNEHSVVHTRVRNFECDLCDAKLVSKSAAIYHRRRHTGEKPYVCDDCGAAFISSSRRLEHAKRKHNKGVKFECLECPARFVRRRELEKHTEKNHKQITVVFPKSTCDELESKII